MPHASREARNRYSREWSKKHPETAASWRKANPARILGYRRNHDARKRYGFPSYAAMVSARNRPCEICGKKARKMCIDHAGPARVFNGTHRGVLCQQCNTRLGWLEANKAVIEAYLERGSSDASKVESAA